MGGKHGTSLYRNYQVLFYIHFPQMANGYLEMTMDEGFPIVLLVGLARKATEPQAKDQVELCFLVCVLKCITAWQGLGVET